MKIKNALLISDTHFGSDKIAQFRGYDDAWHFWVEYQKIHNQQVTYEDQHFILKQYDYNCTRVTSIRQINLL